MAEACQIPFSQNKAPCLLDKRPEGQHPQGQINTSLKQLPKDLEGQIRLNGQLRLLNKHPKGQMTRRSNTCKYIYLTNVSQTLR